MRKSTYTWAGCLLIICIIPFLTQTMAIGQPITTQTEEIPSNYVFVTSFSDYNIEDLSDHYIYFSVDSTANITFLVLIDDLLPANPQVPSYYSNLTETDYIYKKTNITTLSGNVIIEDPSNYYFVFENLNLFALNVTFTLSKKEIGRNALIGGSIISGLGVLGFVAVIVFRKKHHSSEIHMQTASS